MEIVIDRTLTGNEAIMSHPLYGKAVFVECGVHDPANFCYDHHLPNQGSYILSVCGMIHQDLLGRRRMPGILVMNHIRHFDNLMVAYLLTYKGLALNEMTGRFVQTADLMDRVGPLAARSCDQLALAVLNTAQAIIPFKENDVPDADKVGLLKQAVASIKGMTTAPANVVNFTNMYTSEDGLFVIGTADKAIGGALYDEGRDAYAIFVKNTDGTHKWTLARASIHVPFDILAACQELNTLEGYDDPENVWAGRGEIAGSPRNKNSRLPIEKVIEVLKKYYTPA